MRAKIDYAGLQIRGNREEQEDRFSIIEPTAQGEPLLTVVADGMGGHVGGALAAETAVATFTTVMAENGGADHASFHQAVDQANRAIAAEVLDNPTRSGMGCTLVAALLSHEGLYWVSVGDSVLLLCRDGSAERLNADHSLAPQLDAAAARGEISREEALKSSSRHALRSALTGNAIAHLDCPARPRQIQSGDWIIVASDGIDVLSYGEIGALVAQHNTTAFELCEHLLDAVEAKANPRQDNTTIVAIRA